jgi:hypothetical protein
VTNKERRDSARETLSAIHGARLSSVQFVLDYLILGFDEKGALTTLVWPETRVGGRALTFGTPGYRDELCGFIGRVVQSVDVTADETIVVNFEGKDQLLIPLGADKGPGERAIFTTPQHRLVVW